MPLLLRGLAYKTFESQDQSARERGKRRRIMVNSYSIGFLAAGEQGGLFGRVSFMGLSDIDKGAPLIRFCSGGSSFNSARGRGK